MKKVTLKKCVEVDMKPFSIEDFIPVTMVTSSKEKVTKKSLKKLAEELALEYDDETIALSKKLLNAYLEQR